MAEGTAAHVPAPATAILGRHAEVARAKDLLWNPDIRLVSLIGPGGIGKTRLALEVAWDLHHGPGFDDGVYFVDLASVNDPDRVPAAVGRSIGLVDMGTGHDAERLGSAVRDLDMLLVLDNFEQVTPAARLVADLLAAARRVSILVTSRRPLHVRGEHRITVPPLSGADAVALFAARARAVRFDFELDPTTEAVIQSICSELDRLPLAIELAAARTNVLTPAALHARLGARLNVLTSGPTDQPDRLRSMRATISWSYDSLPSSVQTLFRQLSIFSGGFTVEGAEAVCTAPQTPVVDGLAILLDHHLVQRDDTRPETRFAMFETVREFGRHELRKHHDATEVDRRHGAYFSTFVHAAEQELAGPNQALWLDRVEAEHDNIRAALAWSLAAEPDVAIDIAGTMWRFWLLRGYASEGLDWLEHSIAAAGDSPSTARALALMGAGSMFEAIGDDGDAEARYLSGLHDWEAVGDRRGMALAYRHLGNAAVGRGQYDRATDWYLRARRLGQELNDGGMSAGAVSNLGSVAYFQGDYLRAEELWDEAAAFFRSSNDANRLASILNNLAELAALRDDAARAVMLHEEVLVLRQQLRDPIGIAQTLVNLGKVVLGTGDLARARALLEEGLDRLRKLGILRDTGSCLYNLALVDRAEGRVTDAADRAGVSLSIKHAAGEQFDVAQCLELLAGVAADRGLGERGARLLGAASALRRTIGARPPGDEPEATVIYDFVRAAIGDEALAAAIAQGQAWPLERAVAEATEIALVSRSEAAALAPVSLVVPAITPAAQRLGLTARELEVLGYLVQRYTDREIAAALTISLRTVTTHVGRVLTKLGVSGRRQAATEAARLGLLAS